MPALRHEDENTKSVPRSPQGKVSRRAAHCHSEYVNRAYGR